MRMLGAALLSDFLVLAVRVEGMHSVSPPEVLI